jgi:Putative DNA-binding domain
MLPLADLQRDFVRAILDADEEGFDALPLRAGAISSGVALSVYRNTVLGALANALRLTFPTVEKLVGEQFFDQLCAAFIESRPPKDANLAMFGDGFADFIRSYAPAAELNYLTDVARLDHAVDRALLKPDAQVVRRFAIDANVSLDIPLSLSVLRLHYPADLIRDGLDAGDDEALARIDLAHGERWLVLWRAGRKTMVRPVSAPAGAFLDALLAAMPADEALAIAARDAPLEVALANLQTDIFASGFVRVIDHQAEGNLS